MNEVGPYQEREFPKARTATIDTVDMGLRKHHVPILLEVDVTAAREAIRVLKDKTGVSLSFTGWVVKCIGQAVSEHKYVHAMRRGRKKLVEFEDVDVSIVIERAQTLGERGKPDETLPMPYVIRRANQKSLMEIHEDIRSAQALPTDQSVYLGPHVRPSLQSFFFSLPQSLRKLLLWRRLVRDPFFAKRMMGTVVVTSVGMFGKGSGSSVWPIPVGIHPLVFGLGSIARKPSVVSETRVEIRDHLSMTMLFDHDVTDGAPVTRFVNRLVELMESGYCLNEVGSPDISTSPMVHHK